MACMPRCSYRLRLNYTSESFFGSHKTEQAVEYYAKGYSSWLGIVQSLGSVKAVYEVFATRYSTAIEALKRKGHTSKNANINAELYRHIQQEWCFFLDGTYGLCTDSGLPEDIAAKEFSIIEINELLQLDELNSSQLDQLTRAVNLLDSSSSLFAPHERQQSTRYRYVNEVRRKYKLVAR